MSQRRALVTGGAGFLGAHLVQTLRRRGIPVRLLDRKPAPDWVEPLGIEYRQADVRNPAAVASALEDVDSVIHAAFASPRDSAAAIVRVNVEGTRSVCAAARDFGVRRVVLVSSTIVTALPSGRPRAIRSPLARLDLYRRSRIEAEAIVEALSRHSLSVAIARPKTFLGPGSVSAFGLLFDWVRRGRVVPVLGAGRNRYQLLDVRDLAEGLSQLAAASSPGVFAFGARDVRSVREELEALLAHAGTGARLRSVPFGVARGILRATELAHVAPLPEWHYMTTRAEDSVLDTSRTEALLGWRARWSNAETLADAFDWYVRTLAETGAAPATHPPPLAHRALGALLTLASWRPRIRPAGQGRAGG